MKDIHIKKSNNLLPPIITHLSLKCATYVGKTSCQSFGGQRTELIAIGNLGIAQLIIPKYYKFHREISFDKGFFLINRQLIYAIEQVECVLYGPLNKIDRFLKKKNKLYS